MHGPEARTIADDWNTPNRSVYMANTLVSYLGMLPNVVYTSASATNPAFWIPSSGAGDFRPRSGHKFGRGSEVLPGAVQTLARVDPDPPKKKDFAYKTSSRNFAALWGERRGVEK